MKYPSLVAPILLFSVISGSQAATPKFEEIGVLEKMGADPYNGFKLCFPYITFVDFDGDSKKDVIMGGVTYPSNSGKVYIFKNSSPTSAPNSKFEKGIPLKAGGSDISVSSN